MFYFTKVLFTIFLLSFTTQAIDIPKDHQVRDTFFNTKGVIIRFKDVTVENDRVAVVLVARLEKEKKYLQVFPKVKIEWKNDDENLFAVGEYVLSIKLMDRKIEERYENQRRIPYKFLTKESKLKVRDDRTIYGVDVARFERPDGTIYKRVNEHPKHNIALPSVEKHNKENAKLSVFGVPKSELPLEHVFRKKSKLFHKVDPMQAPPAPSGTPMGTPNSKPSAPPQSKAKTKLDFASDSSDSD